MEEMIALLNKLAPQEGYTRSRLACVRFMRSDRPLGRTPVVYEPSIVIICQGAKRGYLADKVYHYDKQHYLVLSVPLPFSTETEGSPQEPLLGLAVSLDMTVLSELVMTIGSARASYHEAPEGIISTPLDERLTDTTLRLLRALSSEQEAAVLGPQVVRELYYRVLVGERGGAIKAALASQGHFASISQVLLRIHDDYSQPFNISTLASELGLSVPVFHRQFKAVTRTTPLQYIKSVRLNQARLLMIRDDLSAASAAFKVGYESPSQFNREFRRLFGRSPGEEAKEMKASLALLPPV